jgi:hypothetical protein
MSPDTQVVRYWAQDRDDEAGCSDRAVMLERHWAQAWAIVAADLVVQRVDAEARLGLRFRVQRHL